LAAGIIAVVVTGVIVLMAGVALPCCADSDLLLHAENPTAAIAAKPTAKIFVCMSFMSFGSF
jgi:hypothetical protein